MEVKSEVIDGFLLLPCLTQPMNGCVLSKVRRNPMRNLILVALGASLVISAVVFAEMSTEYTPALRHYVSRM